MRMNTAMDLTKFWSMPLVLEAMPSAYYWSGQSIDRVILLNRIANGGNYEE